MIMLSAVPMLTRVASAMSILEARYAPAASASVGVRAGS
jgi:hypothetical protein